jgi:hypothetical protein
VALFELDFGRCEVRYVGEIAFALTNTLTSRKDFETEKEMVEMLRVPPQRITLVMVRACFLIEFSSFLYVFLLQQTAFTN